MDPTFGSAPDSGYGYYADTAEQSVWPNIDPYPSDLLDGTTTWYSHNHLQPDIGTQGMLSIDSDLQQ